MPASAEPGNLNLLDERRSAHASIRGYLYQTCLGVLRWLNLQENEVLLCEGDEDLDRFLLGGGAVSEQVKAYTGGLSITDRVVRDSLRNFLRSYVTLRQRGEGRKFVFTTTAAYEKQRRGGLDFDLLEAWKSGDRGVEVIEKVRSLVEPPEKDPKRLEVEAASLWLDGQSEGWTGFMDAVEWSFGAPDLDGIRQTIRSRLSTQMETRALPANDLLDRLIVRVLEAHIQEEPKDRTLTRKDFIDTAHTDIGMWAASSMAVRIRNVFDEIGHVRRLLTDGTSPLPKNPAPAKLLTAAYEVIPFDESSCQMELDRLTTWSNSDERRLVLRLIGEGGTGKTRLMIEWCHRLRQQGWQAGFLRRDRQGNDLDPLLEGSVPRLVVVDYAETRVEDLRRFLEKMGQTPEDEGPKLRLLLLARTESDWWFSLSRTDREVEDLLGNAQMLRRATIPPISKELAMRERIFRAAYEEFARLISPCGPCPESDLPDLEKREFDRVLYIHMAALAAVRGKRVESVEDAWKEILKHEHRFWQRLVRESIQDSVLVGEFTEALAYSVAAITLLGGAVTAERARELLDHVLKDRLSPYHLRKILDLLRRLYSAEDSGLYLAPLQPDLLGEELVASMLSKDFLRSMLAGTSPEEDYHAMRVLILLARRHEKLDAWIGFVLDWRPNLYKAVVELSGEAGESTRSYYLRDKD